LIAADEIDAVVIATRHDSHAKFAVRALQAGKHVFVEKPLAITAAEIDTIVAAWEGSGAPGSRPHVVVGFNRRFAPQVQRMRSLLESVREPKSVIATVNAGTVGAGHWTRDPLVGGGRIIGEACHFVDLLRYLVDQPIVDAVVHPLEGAPWTPRGDNATIVLRFADGSTGTVHYLTNGHRSFPKERIEIFCAGRVLCLDNFRRLRGYGWPGFERLNLWRQDKGQRALVQAFVDAIRSGGDPPIPFQELVEVGKVVIALGEAARGLP
jgi:predicted dehydrogenase